MKKRSDGRYLLTMTLPNGQRKYFYGATQTEVKKKYNEFNEKYLLGDIKDKTMPFKKMSEIWYEHKENSGISHSRLRNYEMVLRLHVLPVIGRMPLGDIKMMHIQKIITNMSGLSKEYQKEVIKIIKQTYDYAIANDIVFKNPCKDIVLNGSETDEKLPLTFEQQQKLIEVTKGTRAETFVLIGLYCGLRRGELLALEWSDIDLKNQLLIVSKSANLDVNQPKNKAPKSKAGNRTIPIPLHIMPLLKELKKDGYVVQSADGKQCSETAHKRMWQTITKNIDFHVTPHLMRHTYITSLYHAGVDIKTAQYLAGHADVTTTLKIYTHLEKGNTKNAGDKLSEYYKNMGVNAV